METITNNTFGLAMYLACEYASNLEYKRQHDQKLYEAELQHPDEYVMADYAPHLFEEQHECNDDILPLLHFCEDMQDAQTNLFTPTEFIELCKTLFDLVRKGEFTGICAIQECLYRLPEDSDIEIGAMIDSTFLLTFHERMSAAKNPKVWSYGHFLAAADFIY